MSAALATALAFARHGHAVLPLFWPIQREGRLVCSCGKLHDGRDHDVRSRAKHPLTKWPLPNGSLIAPKGLLSATTEPGIIKHWWSLAPDANVGVVAASLIPLDVDPEHGGLASLRKLEAEHGPLPLTWTTVTGTGGLHYYYCRPPGLDLSLPIIASQQREPPFGPGIDVPGYLIAPPSRHICGQPYRWEVDGDPRDVTLADAPHWMVDQLVRRAATRSASLPPEEWAKLTTGIISEYRDLAAAKVAGKLLRAVSIDPAFAAGLLTAWNLAYCRPPLADDELRQVFQRIARAEAQRLEQGR